MNAVQHARWLLAVASELAQPQSMELRSICDARLDVVDFEWTAASPTAAHAFAQLDAELVGCRLLDILGKMPYGASLFKAYRSVAMDGISLKFVAGQLNLPLDSVAVHEVTSTSAGVAVVLTNPAAIRRKAAAEIALRLLES